MKILVTSYVYPPSVGGIETVSELMARAFAQSGHSVEVLTETKETSPDGEPFPVHRAPGWRQIWSAVARADVVWQNNISLKYLWACLLLQKPTAVTLACAVHPDYPVKRWRERIKAHLLQYCRIFAISRYVMSDMPWAFELIGNPYDDSIRSSVSGVSKDRDIVFLGRLVSDKGGDLLLDALAQLKAKGYEPSCTIIGDGPERGEMEAQVDRLQLQANVHFTGFLRGRELHRELARHRIMAVPSRWKEPFGVVALEGIAAGCVVVGSSGGGLVDAIGPCGLTFANNDSGALTAQLEQLLGKPEQLQLYTGAANVHLRQFSIERQCERYLGTFKHMLREDQVL
ncbi:glycosyltransferase family 4 protein [Coraliomargarita parva]|uniref:glycosyltransferase family 4 protein n=1 Tax=Coraliomargarita parva TaxID=3014050 RepID=UPI0022B4166C|nr:glycosyltransferase family 4 protein [Coraliomargarita parva]